MYLEREMPRAKRLVNELIDKARVYRIKLGVSILVRLTSLTQSPPALSRQVIS